MWIGDMLWVGWVGLVVDVVLVSWWRLFPWFGCVANIDIYMYGIQLKREE